MKIIKLLKAVKNIDQIYEGIKNNIFKSDNVEAIADHRWLICKDCTALDVKGKKCAAPKTQPCCADCGCSLAIKLRALSSSCPKKKWDALLPEHLEDFFKKQVKYKE